MQAIKDGVARIKMTWQEAYDKAKTDIGYSRSLTDSLTKNGFIKTPPETMLQDALIKAIEKIK
jgi:malate dehydrogenase (oxaloacetate-decarboxylating)